MKITKNKLFLAITLLITIAFVVGCDLPGTTPAQPTVDATAFFQSALLTATYGVPSATPIPSATSTPTTALPAAATLVPTSAVPRTPPALPAVFKSDALNPLDIPHTYVQDTCQYLRDRWNPNNSAPGTVLMPVMLHSISDAAVPDANAISQGTLSQLLKNLKDQGFEAITMQQASDFLYHNAKIPNRSVLLIVDDRRNKSYYDTHFASQLHDYHWTLINSWISLPDSITASALPGNVELQNEGLVDHQAHGVVHNINISEWAPGSTISTSQIPAWGDIMKTVADWPAGTFFDPGKLSNGYLDGTEFIHLELYGSMNLIQKNFGKRPIAYIWPGGGFSSLAVKMAKEAGYLLGFTTLPRGPVMYNWIPLADSVDPNRPLYAPEGKDGNPLMVLPRFWDTDASKNIDTVRQIGKAAAASAAQTKATELDYYDIVCKPILGDIPAQAQ